VSKMLIDLDVEKGAAFYGRTPWGAEFGHACVNNDIRTNVP
jgi:hypothetical protein